MSAAAVVEQEAQQEDEAGSDEFQSAEDEPEPENQTQAQSQRQAVTGLSHADTEPKSERGIEYGATPRGTAEEEGQEEENDDEAAIRTSGEQRARETEAERDTAGSIPTQHSPSLAEREIGRASEMGENASVSPEGVQFEWSEDEQQPLLAQSNTETGRDADTQGQPKIEPLLLASVPQPETEDRTERQSASLWQRAREREPGGGLRLLAAMDREEDREEHGDTDALRLLAAMDREQERGAGREGDVETTSLMRALSADLTPYSDGISQITERETETDRHGDTEGETEGKREEEEETQRDRGSGRLSCCGCEPDPVLVTVLLAQLLHIAVTALLWFCFWRRLCLASVCYAAVMVHSGLFPADIVPALDYFKCYLQDGRPGRQYLEDYLNRGRRQRTDTMSQREIAGDIERDKEAGRRNSVLRSAPRALLLGVGIGFVAFIAHCVLITVGVADMVTVSAFNVSASLWQRQTVHVGLLPLSRSLSVFEAILPDIAMVVIGCMLLAVHV